MASKRRSILTNTAIIAAVITLCGSVVSAVLANPALLELVRGGKATQTSFPSTATLTPPPPLPDLVTVAISSPVCITDRSAGATSSKYVRHTITVRNLGPGSTVPFGAFSSRVVLIINGQRYTLDQWASEFNGVIGTPQLDVPSLGPNDDADLTVSIDLRGNSKYSLEVIANSGPSVISESNTANNTLTRDFTTNCK